MAVSGEQLTHLWRVAVGEGAETECFDDCAVAERAGGVRGDESVSKSADWWCCFGGEPASRQTADLKAECFPVAAEGGDEAA